MPVHEVPASGHRPQHTAAPKLLPECAGFSALHNEPACSADCSSKGDEEINLASESVAGEEDPGASLDILPGVSS